MITGPVAVIPLACGRLELGLWPCGRLDTTVARPVAVIRLACGRVAVWLQGQPRWLCITITTFEPTSTSINTYQYQYQCQYQHKNTQYMNVLYHYHDTIARATAMVVPYYNNF